MPSRLPVDHEALRHQLAGRCFICALVSGDPEFRHAVLYEDDVAIAFLSKYPTVPGYALVAPKDHREQVTGDFSIEEYARLHRVIYRVGEALRRAVPTERLYILSLGSQQANSHVHWHVVPLPPGVPFEEQQYAMLDQNDYLSFSDDEACEIAERIRAEFAVPSADQ
ncbi:MAG TPA: HIT family protein [Candidatus Dormibacteraeota bacterium]